MIFAFITAMIIAIIFIILWSEERDKLTQAELKIRNLTKENRRLKAKASAVVVEKPKRSKGYVIPQPVEKKEEPLLDQAKLAALKEQTKAAQQMLAEIFIQDDQQERIPLPQSDVNPMVDILTKLMTREQWTRKELQELVGPDVMLGNLLEQVNDYSYSIVNDIVVEEDEDNIYVTTDYKQQLI